MSSALQRVEQSLDALIARRNRGIVGRKNLVIVPYRGYGNEARLVVRGRVIEERGVFEVHETDPVSTNVRNMFKRFISRVAPEAVVRAEGFGTATHVVTDDDGFFTAVFEPSRLPDPERAWHEVELELVDPPPEQPGRATAGVLTPPAEAEFGVISDIDDTIMHTQATDMFRMVRIVMLNSAHDRLPFAGVSAFYNALAEGSSGLKRNPFFYVSSSAWNIHDVMEDFMELHDLPKGPILLRDVDFSLGSLVGSKRHHHKIDRIREILSTYPHLPFILIGDSGQKDVELYSDVVTEWPGRVHVIYIREVVDDPTRRQKMDGVVEACRRAGTEVVVVEDTLAAARHAAENGWIEPGRVEAVAAAKASDQPKDPLEALHDRVRHQLSRVYNAIKPT